MEKALRNNGVAAAYLLLRKEGKVLVARRYNTGYQDGNYQVPAGHVDAGELPSETLIREAKEEIGITIRPDQVRFAHASFRPKHDPTGDRNDYFFEVSEWEGEVANMEPHKCDDLQWVSPNELPPNMSPHVRAIIESIERGEVYSELGHSFLKAHNLIVE